MSPLYYSALVWLNASICWKAGSSVKPLHCDTTDNTHPHVRTPQASTDITTNSVIVETPSGLTWQRNSSPGSRHRTCRWKRYRTSTGATREGKTPTFGEGDVMWCVHCTFGSSVHRAIIITQQDYYHQMRFWAGKCIKTRFRPGLRHVIGSLERALRPSSWIKRVYF